MKDTTKKYVSAMVKVETYKNLKQLSLDLGIPLTRVIDLLYDEYKKQKADKD